jgi:hypothetical protein
MFPFWKASLMSRWELFGALFYVSSQDVQVRPRGHSSALDPVSFRERVECTEHRGQKEMVAPM